MPDSQQTAFLAIDSERSYFSSPHFSRDKEGSYGPQAIKAYILPLGWNGREDINDARVALEEHFLQTSGVSEITFECEGTIKELGLSAFRLVAVSMERVP